MSLGRKCAVVLSAALAASAAGAARASALPGPSITLLNNANTFSFGAGLAPAISDGQIVFNGPNGAVFTENADGSGLTQVLSSSTPVPQGVSSVPGYGPATLPAGDTFDQYYGNQERIGDGKVVFVGTDPRTSANTSGIGLYSVSTAGGAITPLAVTGANFPFDFQVSDNGQVAFQYRQGVYTVPAAGGGVTTVAAGPIGLMPGCCSIWEEPDTNGSTVVLAGGNVVGGGAIVTGPAKGFTSSNTTILAQTITPGSLYGGSVSDPKIDFKTGTVVYQANTEFTGVNGIYTSTGGTLFTNGMTAAGGSSPLSLGGNGHGPQIAASNGVVVFEATDANNNVGLYEVSETGGPITKIVAAGDTIGQGVVHDVDIGAEPFSQGKLVFTLNFNCTFGDCPMGGGTSIYEADLTPTRSLSLQGGKVASPVLLPVGNAQIGQVQADIGGAQSSDIYEYSWSGGWFTSDAFVAGAQSSDSYLFDLLGLNGQLIDQVLLDSADSFQGTLARELGAGDYLIGLVCDGTCSDPNGVINFDTPVDGLSAAAVPEPATWAMMLLGILGLGAVLRRRAEGRHAVAQA